MHDPDPVLTRVLGYSLLVVMVALLIWPALSQAKDVAVLESRGDRVVLTDQPCTSSVREKIKPEWRDKFRAASYYVGQKRQTVQGCYLLYGDEYQMIFEDGDVFALPMHMFKQVRI